MQETIINWQGFETWSPQWDVAIVVGAALIFTAVFVLFLKTDETEGEE